MWRYGSGQARRVRVTVAEAEQQRKARVVDARKRAAETLKRRTRVRLRDPQIPENLGGPALVLYDMLSIIYYMTPIYSSAIQPHI